MTTSKKKKKKRPYTPPMKLSDFSPSVQKSARTLVSHYKNDMWWLNKQASAKAPTVPTKKLSKVPVEVRVNSDGKGWNRKRHDVERFMSNMVVAFKKAQHLGARDCKVEFSDWDGLKIIGYREETDAEFQKRIREAQVKRATIVAAREMRKNQEAEELKRNQERNQQRRERAFVDAARNLNKKDIERLLKEAKPEKESDKKTP